MQNVSRFMGRVPKPIYWPWMIATLMTMGGLWCLVLTDHWADILPWGIAMFWVWVLNQLVFRGRP